ncbi:MAG: hypothetical protein M1832_000866 [Thelocarpon impressellum]|nr:MAG: hypothetical protein M1832_000866 [Thelocarpon impressellum]
MAAPSPATDPTPAQSKAPDPSNQDASGPPAAVPAEAGEAQDTPIEVDSIQFDSDKDSAFGDDMSSFTASLESSVVNYPYENGRRYHAFREGAYNLPNDEKENDRLDIVHHMVTLRLDGKLHLAPIGKNPQRVLDIGTGTGIWAIEMGDEYPSAEVFGNDLSPVQPNMVPPNVKFEIDDVESEWTYPAPFDYIHCRYMAVSIADWPALVRRCYENLKPGGWVEFHDFTFLYYSEDGSMTPDMPMAKWDRDGLDASAKIGRDGCPGPKIEGWVRDQGFVDVYHQRLKMPLGRWPKDELLKAIGTWNLLQTLEGLEAFSFALYTRVLGWSHDEVQVLMAKVRKDLRNPNIHAQYDMHVVYARRPETDAV